MGRANRGESHHSKNVQTKDDRVKQVFAVTVDLGDGEGALRPGMPADARLGPR